MRGGRPGDRGVDPDMDVGGLDLAPGEAEMRQQVEGRGGEVIRWNLQGVASYNFV